MGHSGSHDSEISRNISQAAHAAAATSGHSQAVNKVSLDHPVPCEPIATTPNGGPVIMATQTAAVGGEGGDKSLAEADRSTFAPRRAVAVRTCVRPTPTRRLVQQAALLQLSNSI